MNVHRVESEITRQGAEHPAFVRASVLYITGGFAYVRAIYREDVPFYDGGERDEAWDVRGTLPEYVRDVCSTEDFDELVDDSGPEQGDEP